MKKHEAKRRPAQRRIIVAVTANVLMIAVVVLMSVALYQKMLNAEEQNCWNILEDSAEAIEKEINIQVENNLNVLKLVSGAMIREQRGGGSQEDLNAILAHLNDFQNTTIFDRIDVLMENGTILLQTGEVRPTTIDFQTLSEKGIHISGRKTDIVTEKDVVICLVPVVDEAYTVAILMGVIECEKLPETFSSSMYDGKAYVCLVDRPTGDFIMDDWHDSLGNLYDMKKEKRCRAMNILMCAKRFLKDIQVLWHMSRA